MSEKLFVNSSRNIHSFLNGYVSILSGNPTQYSSGTTFVNFVVDVGQRQAPKRWEGRGIAITTVKENDCLKLILYYQKGIEVRRMETYGN
jgi:hypothetical protein